MKPRKRIYFPKNLRILWKQKFWNCLKSIENTGRKRNKESSKLPEFLESLIKTNSEDKMGFIARVKWALTIGRFTIQSGLTREPCKLYHGKAPELSWTKSSQIKKVIYVNGQNETFRWHPNESGSMRVQTLKRGKWTYFKSMKVKSALPFRTKTTNEEDGR